MTEATTPPVIGEIAASTGNDFGLAFVGDLRTPTDPILLTRGRGDLALYESVLRDGQVKATYEQRRLAVVAREWGVEAGGDRPIDIEAADDLREQLTSLDWDDVSKKMLTAPFYGFSVGECIWGAGGSRITLDAVKVRKARRFRFDRDNALRLITRDEPLGIVMPEQKFWIFRAGSDDDDDPYGLGLAHWLYWPVWFKRNGMRFWALFLERFASPTPIAKHPPGAKADEVAKLLNMLSGIVTGGRIAIPNNVALDLLQAMHSSGGDYLEFVKYLDSDIAKIVLSQTMTTDSGSSLSQAVVHQGVKLEVIKSDADLECESFNRQVATWLTAWNYPGAAVPRVWRDCSEPADLKTAAERDAAILTVGYRPTADRIQKTYGDGYEPVPAGPPPATGGAAAFAEAPPAAPIVGPADAVLTATTEGDEWRRLLGPEVELVESLLADAKSLEEVRDRLGELAKRDPDAITNSLARVMFAGSIAGQAGAELDGD